ncbi:MAG: hypothetical protein IJG57_05575 [Firmicutes bacterium]|nr:hypothetical protein [Bacillota bacterium]
MRVYEVSWEEEGKRNRRHALVKGRTERDAKRKADEYARQEEGLVPESAVLAEIVTKTVEGQEIEIRKISADWIMAFCSIANTTRRGYYLTWDSVATEELVDYLENNQNDPYEADVANEIFKRAFFLDVGFHHENIDAYKKVIGVDTPGYDRELVAKPLQEAIDLLRSEGWFDSQLKGGMLDDLHKKRIKMPVIGDAVI